MNAPVILVLGQRGSGKTLWHRLFARSHNRLLVYDPSAVSTVEYLPADELLDALVTHQQPEFRYGTYRSDDVQMVGCLAYYRGSCTLILEEASLLFSKGGRLEPWLSRLVFLGRHRDITMILVAQRAMSIPIDVRSQADRVVTFCQIEGDDISWLASRFGEHTPSILTLARFECLDGSRGVVSRYSIREAVELHLGIVPTLDTDGIYMVP